MLFSKDTAAHSVATPRQGQRSTLLTFTNVYTVSIKAY